MENCLLAGATVYYNSTFGDGDGPIVYSHVEHIITARTRNVIEKSIRRV